ncbi:MAG: alpha/beta hydrolase [Cyanobacteria bacterium P01_D01_bin.105]
MPTATILGVPHAYDLWSPAPSSNPPEQQSQHTTETIVFIHGWLLSRSYWQPLIDELSTCQAGQPAHYQYLTYDMRGFGESQPRLHEASSEQNHTSRAIPLPPGKNWYPNHSPNDNSPDDNSLNDDSPYRNDSFSLAAYAQDLAALLDELKLDQVWLMGHSLGGSVALWAAYLFPTRVKGVLCLNAGGGIYIPKEFEKFRGAGQQMVKYRPQWLTKLPGLPRVFTRAMVHKPLALKWGQQRLQDFVCANRAAAEGALLASTTQAEVLQLPQLMGELAQPVHFITATQDSIMPPRYVNYLASFHSNFQKHCPQRMVAEIAECGHMAMVEQPKAVANIVKAFVDGTGFDDIS